MEEVVLEILIFQVFSDFSQIFLKIFLKDFGGEGKKKKKIFNFRGADLRYDLSISLEDAYTGKKQEIKFSSSEKCKLVMDSGSKPGS